MTTKHAQKIADNDPNLIQVIFATDIVRALSRLERAVKKSELFDPDALEALKECAANKPLRMRDALVWVALFARDAERIVQKTGDKETMEALSEFLYALMGQNIHSNPLRLASGRGIPN